MEKILAHQHHEVKKELDKVTREVTDMQKEINKVLQNADTQINTCVKKQASKRQKQLQNWSTN